jgi:hypothetical protein
VVGIGGMPHPKKKPDSDNGKQSKHVIRRRAQPVIRPAAN